MTLSGRFCCGGKVKKQNLADVCCCSHGLQPFRELLKVVIFGLALTFPLMLMQCFTGQVGNASSPVVAQSERRLKKAPGSLES